MVNDLKPIVKKMNELFIMERKKYIIQNEDGTYNWLSANKNNHVKNFHDYMLESHLKRKKTYGIFSGKTLSKFISFDVDIPNHEIIYSIYNELNDIGIDSEFIYTSSSGSKGYHVDIYFSEPILLSRVKQLYNYITSKLKLKFVDIDINKKVELRPNSNQGLKLPLGINQKNKNSSDNICWYVNIWESLKPIKNLEYILSIEQIDKKEIIEKINQLPNIQKPTKIPSKSDEVKLSHDGFETIHKNNTIHSLEKLNENGLTTQGTRNESLCRLALYYKELGATKEQCKNKLCDWMNKQDTRYYKTPLKTCYEEIERITHGVYSKNIRLKTGKTRIKISRNELLSLHFYGKLARDTLYFLFIHSKRYEDVNEEFFMTYSQLMKAGNYSKTTAINHIKILEKAGAIEVTRSPIFFNDYKPRNLPNKYKLNLNIGLIDNEENRYIVKSVKSLTEYNRISLSAKLELFPEFEFLRMEEILESLLAQNEDNFKTKKLII